MLGRRDSDQQLIARTRAGDEQAFERLYERYEPMIFGFCRHLTGQREDAEDAVQHTFMAAYRQLAESDRRVDLRPWLFTVARNRCLTVCARRARLAGRREYEEPAVDDLADEVQRREDLRNLVLDLGRLPEPQRAALLLSACDALSHNEVARILDVPPAKVKALVFQARSSLAATREARDAACGDVRRQLATLSGSALRRRLLRRHVRDCDGCREFAAAIASQRRGVALLLPGGPSLGLAAGAWRQVLGRGGSHGSAADAAQLGGAVTGSGAAAGGALLGGASSLTLVGGTGVAKLALAAVVVGGVAGASTSVSPLQVPDRAASLLSRMGSPASPKPPGAPAVVRGEPTDLLARTWNGAGEVATGRTPVASVGQTSATTAVSVPSSSPSSHGAHGPGANPSFPGSDPLGPGGEGGPPGLAKKGGVPPGLADADGLPPGLAKKDGVPPGRAGNAHRQGDKHRGGAPGAAPSHPRQAAGGGNGRAGDGPARPGSGGRAPAAGKGVGNGATPPDTTDGHGGSGKGGAQGGPPATVDRGGDGAAQGGGNGAGKPAGAGGGPNGGPAVGGPPDGGGPDGAAKGKGNAPSSQNAGPGNGKGPSK